MTVAFATAALAASPCAAQQVQPALPVLDPLIGITEPDDALITVAQRYRPDFEPRGIRSGALLIYPSVRTAAGYAANIFATEDDTRNDAFFVVEPQVTARTVWTTNELRMYAKARYLDYFQTDNADEPSYAIGADAHLGMQLPLNWELGASFGQQIERRDSSAFPLGQVSPVRYRRGNAYVRGIYEGGLGRVIASADITNFDFSAVKALDDDLDVVARIDQAFRDRTEIRGAARVEYVVAPRVATYVQGNYSNIAYDSSQLFVGGPANRDGDEFEAMIGATFDLSLFRGEIGVGYVRHDYSAGIYPTIEGVSANARVTYYVTPLLTIIADASRTVEETALTTASGFFSTLGRVHADYELLRNLILNAEASYRHNDFEGDKRKDRIFRIGAGGRYSVSRRLALDFGAVFLDRDTTGAISVPSFRDFQVVVGTTFSI